MTTNGEGVVVAGTGLAICTETTGVDPVRVETCYELRDVACARENGRRSLTKEFAFLSLCAIGKIQRVAEGEPVGFLHGPQKAKRLCFFGLALPGSRAPVRRPPQIYHLAVAPIGHASLLVPILEVRPQKA